MHHHQTGQGKQITSCALVLGGGGARGLAHIGIINWLQENNIKIKAISGSSIGALIGALHAVDRLDEYQDWMTSLSSWDVIRLLELSIFTRSSIIKADKVFDRVRLLLGDTLIESLDIDYTAVATDLNAGQEVWFQQGDLFAAVRASVAIPTLLSPIRQGDRLLVDGGLLNPVPIAPVLSTDADITIAVDLAGPSYPEPLKPYKKIPTRTKNPAIADKILKFFERESAPPADHMPSVIDLTSRSIDVMQTTISRSKLAAYPADYHVVLPKNSCDLLDFDECDALVQLGYHSANKQLNHLTKRLERHAKAPEI